MNLQAFTCKLQSGHMIHYVSSIIISTVIAIDIVLVLLYSVSSCDLCFHIQYVPHSPLKLYTE